MQLRVSTGAEKPDQKWMAILDLAIESCACVDPTVSAFYITDKLHVELPKPTQNPGTGCSLASVWTPCTGNTADRCGPAGPMT